MLQDICFKRRTPLNHFILVCGMAVLIVLISLPGNGLAGQGKQKIFPSPQVAVSALAQAMKNNNIMELLRILGPDSASLISTGDEVQDRQHRGKFASAYEAKHHLVRNPDGSFKLLIGKDDWPFPFPIVKGKRHWHFNTQAGKEEVLSRHIGKNELNTIQVCLAIADAQRDYAEMMGVTNGQPEYAQQFESSPGKKDGLYWEVAPEEKISPLGPLVAQARAEGYSESVGKAVPYHGYLFKILTAQGEKAHGGAHSYIIQGKLVGGFAIAAFPAVYGSSGIHTFIVNHEGIVYRKNLGTDTAAAAAAMTQFNPDETWKKVD
jgi:hypothetical protein